jgi:hypothetical protein
VCFPALLQDLLVQHQIGYDLLQLAILFPQGSAQIPEPPLPPVERLLADAVLAAQLQAGTPLSPCRRMCAIGSGVNLLVRIGCLLLVRDPRTMLFARGWPA